MSDKSLEVNANSKKESRAEKQKTILTTTEAEFIAGKHLELWNERDTSKHLELMKSVYSAEIEMVDRDFIANGFSEVERFLNGLHQKNPEGSFRLRKPVESHHNLIRIYWQNGPVEKPDAVTGMDLFVIEHGQVEKLYVFVDQKV
jgi:hypothetical protein